MSTRSRAKSRPQLKRTDEQRRLELALEFGPDLKDLDGFMSSRGLSFKLVNQRGWSYLQLEKEGVESGEVNLLLVAPGGAARYKNSGLE